MEPCLVRNLPSGWTGLTQSCTLEQRVAAAPLRLAGRMGQEQKRGLILNDNRHETRAPKSLVTDFRKT